MCWLWRESNQPAAPPAVPSVPPISPRPRTFGYTAALPLGAQPQLRRMIRRHERPVRALRPPKVNLPRIFLPEHVNTLARMIARHSPGLRFICVADSSAGLKAPVEWLQTPDAAKALAELRSPEGERFPSCYRRLWVFSKDAHVLGDEILTTDIDAVVLKPLEPLFDCHRVAFVGWRPYRDWGRKLRFGGGTYLLRIGARTQVWEQFKGAESIQVARAAGFRGSDQAWISYMLAEKEPYFTKEDGIYSVRDLGNDLKLPADARLVHFNGQTKPWHYIEAGGRLSGPWVSQHWR